MISWSAVWHRSTAVYILCTVFSLCSTRLASVDNILSYSNTVHEGRSFLAEYGPFGHNRRTDRPRSAMTWRVNPQLSAGSRRSINSLLALTMTLMEVDRYTRVPEAVRRMEAA